MIEEKAVMLRPQVVACSCETVIFFESILCEMEMWGCLEIIVDFNQADFSESCVTNKNKNHYDDC